MNKRVIIIVASIALLILASLGYLLAKGSDETAPGNRTQTAVDQPKAERPDQSESQPSGNTGAYVDYRDGIVAQTSGTKLLFFHAPWCPQCRALEADIKEKGVPGGVTVIKVDYDSNQKLRQQYGVTLQTTVVKVDDAGNLIKKFVAYDDPSLAAITKELL